MNIVATQYDTNHKALEIYVSGCYGGCFHCHNESLKAFNLGEDWQQSLPGILSTLDTFHTMIDRVWILGGEPFDQNPYELSNLIYAIRNNFSGEIWIFTRFEKENLPYVAEQADFIKCGPYKEELITEDNIVMGVKLATSNQYIMQKKDGEWQKIEADNSKSV